MERIYLLGLDSRIVNVERIVTHVREYKGITRKAPVSSVARSLLGTAKDGVIASYGEDAAAIKSRGQILLLAADGILEDLVRTDPHWAGYCSVLVNVNDIAAMGGLPIAMVNVLSCPDEDVRSQIVAGMRSASEKFGVPIVGGHLHPDTGYTAIDVAILGRTSPTHLILSSRARIGDDVIFAMDLDGRFTPGVPYSWDTTSRKSSREVRRRLDVMHKLAPHLHSGKDISNPGSLGTLGMLLEASGKGADVDILRIPHPAGVDLVQWLTAYQGCGFVVACGSSDSKQVTKSFDEVGITATVCGSVTNSRRLEVIMGSEKAMLFDFSKDVLGCARPQKL